MKIIRINRKATATDYARAAAKSSAVINGGYNHISFEGAAKGAGTGAALGTIVPGVGNVVGGIIGAVGGLFAGGDKKDKMNQKQFYQKRDAFYKTAESLGKPVGSLPGNPFTQFAHATIKDSPLKNYMKEWKAFEQMVAIYYPELVGGSVQSGQPTAPEVAQPLNKTMQDAIRGAGGMPPGGGIVPVMEEFNSRVMQPAGAGVSAGAGSEALGNAAIEFISTLMDKKKNGETLPPVYDQIASGGLRVQENVENKVRAGVQGNIGEFVTENIMVIGLAIIILIFAISKK